MTFAAITIFFLLFFFLAWRNFRLAIILFIIFLPAYLIRFNIGPFPSTALELSFGALFLVWLVKYGRADWKNIMALSRRHKLFFIAFDLLFIASVASIFVSDMPIPSLGQWRAYFLEPMILFLILIGRRDAIKATNLIWALALSVVSISAYAVAQKFTGWGIATPEFAAEAGRRVTAFFTSPNAVGLYLAPILMLMLIGAWKKKQRMIYCSMIFLTALAIIFTKSQGAWIGLAAGMLAFLFFVGYKKLAVVLVVSGVILALIFPVARQAVLFQDQAGQNRLRLWGYTWTFLSHSPKNFILGAGVRQFFRKVQKPYYDDQVMERLIYPHNILLNFWTEAGLLGALAATTILGYVFYLAHKISQADKLVGAGLLGALAVLVTHGLVDVPYFKNDLSFLFWIIMALPFYYVTIYQSQAKQS